MIPPAPSEAMKVNTTGTKRIPSEEAAVKQRSNGQKEAQEITNCSASIDNTLLHMRLPPKTTMELECPPGVVQLSDNESPTIKKTPKPSLRAPGLPNAIGRLNLQDSSCIIKPRGLQFISSGNPGDPNDTGNTNCDPFTTSDF
ncbi:uncharacterized protein LOC119353895 [Triticum dicoccoides]|uniref:uncharacterized protein LOC119353895 n=1 Tax=Triticum dicoccoides TaxID=85692 RepID=UPI00188FAE2A|nr:uncharacterized protein LOC119353895 [Triticum dicoccoides]